MEIDIEKYRNEFLKNGILDIRNRIIHDNGYSIKVFKMDDNIFSFQVYDLDLNEHIKVNEVYSYYDLKLLNINPPLIIVENYIVYS